MNVLTYGLTVTGIGLLLVFVGLGILIGLLMLMAVIFKAIDKKKAARKAELLNAVTQEVPAEIEPEEVVDDAQDVGTDELMAQVQAGEFNFDAAVATPDQMGKVGRLGKILGPRGLMPNPKLGTVTNDVAKAINELKGGRVEYRADRYGIAHVVLGKVSFTPEQLAENYGAVYDEILRMKPAAAKGKYVKSITVSGTMTPGVSVDSSVTRAYTESAE